MPAASRDDFDVWVFQDGAVKAGQGILHALLNTRNEGFGVSGQFQRFIIFCPLRIKICWQILVRIAVAVCAHHPDFLAPQLCPERLQDTDFIRDAIDAPLADCPAPSRHAANGGDNALQGIVSWNG